jgi:hypothetical protein
MDPVLDTAGRSICMEIHERVENGSNRRCASWPVSCMFIEARNNPLRGIYSMEQITHLVPCIAQVSYELH